jgi:tetratricopeptide (TPR) repeat protein
MAPTGIPPSKEIDYIKVCFVIMPFGKKPVGDKEIDFDFIYHTVFEPAIAAVVLPEGGQLVPKRTDQDYATGNIDVEMFRYLEYSRFALVDITGLNANVFYELGVRHRGNQSGTAIFRQEKTPLPFDIGHIKAFPYDYEPIEQVPASIEKITRVLSESLVYNRVDSPVQVALQDQQKSAQQARQKGEDDSEAFQIAATNAMRIEDWQTAIDRYKDAVQANEQNPLLHTELGLLLRDQGRWPEAVKNFERATQLSPDYPEAWRELGIARNKLFKDPSAGLPSGEEDLQNAIRLNPDDFDAYASLGGIYKRKKDYDRSLDMYNKSVQVSNGHPYPLVNAIILQIRSKGLASISFQQKVFLQRAEISVRKQVTNNPPYYVPWSFFDLSTICLLTGRGPEAVTWLEKGAPYAKAPWYFATHLDTLMLLEGRKGDLPGWDDLVGMLTQLAV